jgi:hypothetical protein
MRTSIVKLSPGFTNWLLGSTLKLALKVCVDSLAASITVEARDDSKDMISIRARMYLIRLL